MTEGAAQFMLPGGQSHHLELAPEPRAASTARDFVLAELTGIDPTTRDTAALLTSEVVTNGILHARTPMLLGVSTSGSEALVALTDGNALAPEQRPYSEQATSGRGMMLLGALASRWGIATHENGKTVWFVVPLGSDGGV